jgi:hypothetical protein
MAHNASINLATDADTFANELFVFMSCVLEPGVKLNRNRGQKNFLWQSRSSNWVKCGKCALKQNTEFNRLKLNPGERFTLQREIPTLQCKPPPLQWGLF